MPCPICGNAATVNPGNGDYRRIACPRCGAYEITGTMDQLLANAPLPGVQGAYASSWIREHPGIRLASQHEEMLRTVAPPSVAEQASRLLQFLAKRFPTAGQRFSIRTSDMDIMAVAWATDAVHLDYLLNYYLRDSLQALWLGTSAPLNGAYQAVILPKGWEYLAALATVNPASEIGFIAMFFHDSMNDVRDNGLKPAVRLAGYRPLLINEKLHGNRIDAEIAATIRQSRIVVADIRGRRGGVYFEAGFAAGLGLPVFWTCEQRVLSKQRLHFDVRQFPFTPWDPSDWPTFVGELSSLIVAVAGKGPLPNE